MNEAALFREFVASDSAFDTNYSSERFSFITVFYRSTFAYCFCTCGFEHEYLLYLSETGKINEKMFEKLQQSVIDGKCPHVDKASKHQLQETSVNGIYIAAAKGNELAVKDHLDTFDTSVGGIFKLLPLDIAILKGKYCIANMFCKYMRFRNVHVNLGRPIPTVKILDGYPVRVLLETITRIQICLHTQDVELLGMASDVSPSTPLSQALRNTYKQGLSNELRNIVKYHPFLVDKYIESAIIYNHPDALERMLKMTPHYKSTRFPKSFTSMFQLGGVSQLRPFRDSPNVSTPLCSLPLCDENYLCQVLNRETCKRVLSEKGLLHHVDVSTELQIIILLSRLRDFYDDCKEEIIAALKNIPRNQRAMSSNLNNYLTLPHIRNDLFQTVINLGANVNYKDPFGKTPIGNLLKIRDRHDGVMVRQKVALLINENPDVTLHQRDVRRGIERDAVLQARQSDTVPYDMPGEYIADVREHGLFGYDDIATFALNFIGPFLMECGFPAIRSDLHKLLFQYNEPPFHLHPAEAAYIQRYIETPRSLVVICRDSLRKHFGGRRIHEFVEQIGCPQKIKDVILMTQLTATKIYNM